MSKGMWTKHFSVEGKVYYYNAALQKSQWTPPQDSIVHEAVNAKPPQVVVGSKLPEEEEEGLVKENDALSTGAPTFNNQPPLLFPPNMPLPVGMPMPMPMPMPFPGAMPMPGVMPMPMAGMPPMPMLNVPIPPQFPPVLTMPIPGNDNPHAPNVGVANVKTNPPNEAEIQAMKNQQA